MKDRIFYPGTWFSLDHPGLYSAGIKVYDFYSVFNEWCLFLFQFRNFKIVYRRYAGLYFCFCVDVHDNNLYYLEAIHNFVEVRTRNISSSRMIIYCTWNVYFSQIPLLAMPGWLPKVTWPISRPHWCMRKIFSLILFHSASGKLHLVQVSFWRLYFTKESSIGIKSGREQKSKKSVLHNAHISTPLSFQWLPSHL